MSTIVISINSNTYILFSLLFHGLDTYNVINNLVVMDDSIVLVLDSCRIFSYIMESFILLKKNPYSFVNKTFMYHLQKPSKIQTVIVLEM